MWFYDGDGGGYHSDKKTSTGPPDKSGFWFTTSEGPDCDDTNKLRNNPESCKSPCIQLRNMFAEGSLYKRLVDSLSTSAILSRRFEVGFREERPESERRDIIMENFLIGNNNFTELTRTENNHILDVTYAPFTKGITHVHFKIIVETLADNSTLTTGLTSNFYDVDVITFLNIVDFANGSDFAVNDLYTTLITEKGNFVLKFTGDQNDITHNKSAAVLAKRNLGVIPLRALYGRYTSRVNTQDIKGFLRFLKLGLGVQGLSLFEIEDDGDIIEHRLREDSNKRREKIQCADAQK